VENSRRFFFVFAGLVGLGAILFVIGRQEAAHLYHKGEELYLAGSSTEALTTFRKVAAYPSLLGGFVEEARDKVRELEGYLEAQAALQRGDYKAGVQRLEQFLGRFPHSIFAARVRAQELPEAITRWAVKLREEGLFVEAVHKLQDVLQNFPTYAQENALTLMIEQYKNDHWNMALEFLEQGNYEKAAREFHSIARNYQDYAAKAEELLPKIYWDWIQVLVTEKDYGAAVERCTALTRDFSGTEFAGMAYALLPQLYLAWAEQLIDKEHFDEAIKVLNTLLDEFKDSEHAQKAEDLMTKAEVMKIAKLPPDRRGELPTVPGVWVRGLGDPVLVIKNDTSYVLTLRYVGPVIKRLDLQPGATGTLTLPAGRYQVTATVPNPSVIPFYGERVFEANTKYESRFYIVRRPSWP